MVSEDCTYYEVRAQGTNLIRFLVDRSDESTREAGACSASCLFSCKDAASNHDSIRISVQCIMAHCACCATGDIYGTYSVDLGSEHLQDGYSYSYRATAPS